MNKCARNRTGKRLMRRLWYSPGWQGNHRAPVRGEEEPTAKKKNMRQIRRVRTFDTRLPVCCRVYKERFRSRERRHTSIRTVNGACIKEWPACRNTRQNVHKMYFHSPEARFVDPGPNLTTHLHFSAYQQVMQGWSQIEGVSCHPNPKR